MSRQVYIFDHSNFDSTLLLQLIASEDVLAFDTETTGLNVRHDKLIGFSIAGVNFTAYVILKAWLGGTLEEIIPYSAVTPALTALKAKKLITFNGSFDSRITFHQTAVCLLNAIHADGMLLSHTLDENKFNYGLKTLAAEIWGESAINAQLDMKQSIADNGGTKTEFYKANAQLMAKYGAQDAALTYDLWAHYDKQLTPTLRKFFYDDEVMPLYKEVVIPMERDGIPVDVPLLQASLAAINVDIEACEAAIQASIAPLLPAFNEWYVNKEYSFKLTGRFKELLGRKIAPPGWPLTDKGVVSLAKQEILKAHKKGLIPEDSQFERIVNGLEYCPKSLVTEIQLELAAEDGLKYAFNLSSKDHLKRLFFGTKNTPSPLNEKALSHTDKGAPQVDDEFLELMAKKHLWCTELQVYNKLIKLRGTYIEQYLEGQEGGIFYPQVNQHRTTSGRLSGNMQQLPREVDEAADARVQKYNNLVRQFFACPSGYTFVDHDYDSQEVKVFAHVSGDEGLKQIFATGNDFYSTVAIGAEKLQGFSADKSAPNYLGKVAKERRQRAKSYALGLAFGMTPYKLKFELNCSEAEAQNIYNGYMRAYPKLEQWMKRTKVLAVNQGYVETLAGRVRRLPDLKKFHSQYGDALFDGLELWRRFNDQPSTYKWVKEVAGRCKNDLNNAYNVQIQSLAASMTNRAAVKCARMLKAAGLEARIVAITHDQITVLTELTHHVKVGNILTEAMETALPLSVPMTAPPSHGPNLAVSKG